MRHLALFALLAASSAIPGGFVFVLGVLLVHEVSVVRGGASAAPLLDAAPRLLAVLVTAQLGFGLADVAFGAARDAELIDPGAGLRWYLAGGGGAVLAFALVLRVAAPLRERLGALAVDLKAVLITGGAAAALSAGALALPAALVALSRHTGRGAFALLAALAFVVVLERLPFLILRHAAEGRRRLDLRAADEVFARAPVAATFALLGAYALCIPAHFAAVFELPAGALPLVGIAILPLVVIGRLGLVWALRRARRQPMSDLARPMRVVRLTGISAYVLILSFVPNVAASGATATLLHPLFMP